MTFAAAFFQELAASVPRVDAIPIEQMVQRLEAVRSIGGRVFLIGLGGSAANASHLAADLRALCAIQAEALTDSMAEFSASANDDGWDRVFLTMLRRRHPRAEDEILILSVGGGTDTVSVPITTILQAPWKCGLMGIVGRDGGKTAVYADPVVLIPPTEHVTPITEAMQLVVAHLLVTHPALQRREPKWR